MTRIDTLLAHAGGDPEDRHGAVNPPVYRFSTILFPTLADFEASRNPARRFDDVLYGQLGTPTTFALEEAIAAVEGGYRALRFVIEGLLCMDPAPEPVRFDTVLELSKGQYEVKGEDSAQ